MELNEDFISEINAMTELRPVLQLIQAFALEDNSLKEIERMMVMGVDKKFHYMWLETKHYNFKPKDGTITIRGKTYLAEDIWNEIDERIALGKRELIERAINKSTYQERTSTKRPLKV